MNDLRYGIRALMKTPGFTCVAALTLALGIGANTLIFSIVDAVLLRPGREAPSRLVEISKKSRLWGDGYLISATDFSYLRAHSRSFEEIACLIGQRFHLTGGTEPQLVQAALVSSGYLRVQEQEPVQGRAFFPEEHEAGKNRVALISQGLWRRRFAGESTPVGKTLTLDGDPYTVVGVFPSSVGESERTYRGALSVDVIVPLVLTPEVRWLSSVGRLKPGVSIEQARAEMQALFHSLRREHPETTVDGDIAGFAVLPPNERLARNVGPALLILLGAVGLVLLIACSNVANLLLARAVTRRKEMALRAALGATRRRLMRQLLVEGVLLALFGGALGLQLAWWGARLVVAISPTDIPRIQEIGLDAQVLGFVAIASVLTGLVCSLVPALRASRCNLSESLKETGRSTTGAGDNRMRSVLVVSEVALALVLLVGAGLMLQSLWRLQRVDPGFNPDQVVRLSVSLLERDYRTKEQVAAFYQQLTDRLTALPGVHSVGAASNFPLDPDQLYIDYTIEGHTPSSSKQLDPHDCVLDLVSPGYFRVMGIPLRRGRDFGGQDSAHAPGVVVVDDKLARLNWPNEDPIGKRLAISRDPDDRPIWLEIIGVVGNVKRSALDVETRMGIYVPFAQVPDPHLQRARTLMVRASNPLGLAAAVRSVVWAVDRNVPVLGVTTVTQDLAEYVAPRRFQLLMLGSFAGVAMLLAAVGVYGVMAYSVSQRSHEVGIRMALGAQQNDILRLVLGSGLKLTLLGVAGGVAAACVLTRALVSYLYGVTATDPITFVGAALLLTGVAILASYLPARRATRVDPTVALRQE